VGPTRVDQRAAVVPFQESRKFDDLLPALVRLQVNRKPRSALLEPSFLEPASDEIVEPAWLRSL
jgi:hypothetical protein